MKQLLDKIGKTFDLTEGVRFSRAVAKVLDKDTSESKKIKSLEKIFKLVRNAFEDNDVITSMLTKTNKAKLEKINKKFEEEEMTEEFFTSAMQTYLDFANIALENDYANQALAMLKEKNKEIKSSTASATLKTVKKSTSIADKKSIINNVIKELGINMIGKVADKYHITNWQQKDFETEIKPLLPKKVVSSINQLFKLIEKLNKKLQKKLDETLLDDIQNIFDQFDRVLGKNKTQENDEKKPKRKQVKGKTNKRIKASGKKYKAIIKKTAAGILIATVTIGSVYLLSRLIKNAPVQEDPSLTDPIGPEVPNLSTMTDVEREAYVLSEASKIHKIWTEAGCDYTVSDISELIYFVNGYESNISASIADDMMLEVINKSTVPALNNVITGQNNEEVKPIEMSQLFMNGQTGIDAIENMEDYLNEAMKNPNNSANAKNALEEEIRIVDKKETVDGFNVETATPGERLAWSRLALGTNAMTGLLGEDLVINVGEETYLQSDINDFTVFETIAKSAKNDLGEHTKTLTLNSKNN